MLISKSRYLSLFNVFFSRPAGGDELANRSYRDRAADDLGHRDVTRNLFRELYVSVKSKLQHAPPPPGIPRAFDTFAVPGRRKFDYQSLPGGGEFDHHALGEGNLNCTLDFT